VRDDDCGAALSDLRQLGLNSRKNLEQSVGGGVIDSDITSLREMLKHNNNRINK
jgi:hypothetical protein